MMKGRCYRDFGASMLQMQTLCEPQPDHAEHWRETLVAVSDRSGHGLLCLGDLRLGFFEALGLDLLDAVLEDLGVVKLRDVAVGPPSARELP